MALVSRDKKEQNENDTIHQIEFLTVISLLEISFVKIQANKGNYLHQHHRLLEEVCILWKFMVYLLREHYITRRMHSYCDAPKI